ncbi:MAG: hypothetical protein GX066_09905 [Clostridiaceae bacterium]|nr:hypothetical protein [Clostridiaceae bacterium]
MSASINFDGLISYVSECCLTEELCGKCKEDSCIIGYCKKCIITSIKKDDKFIPGGIDNIPASDTKVYDDETVIEAVSYLLHQCRNCNLYHDEECIINIIRSSLEIILLGEPQEYRGSTLLYLNDIKMINPEVADKILSSFKIIKDSLHKEG